MCVKLWLACPLFLADGAALALWGAREERAGQLLWCWEGVWELGWVLECCLER